MNEEQQLAVLGLLEKDLGIRERFFLDLINEDDWSFVIKIHSIFEALLTQLITTKVSEKRLRDYFARLELSDKTRGKLRLCKDLGLLEKDERRFYFCVVRGSKLFCSRYCVR